MKINTEYVSSSLLNKKNHFIKVLNIMNTTTPKIKKWNKPRDANPFWSLSWRSKIF
jgi:hypothetical protein